MQVDNTAARVTDGAPGLGAATAKALAQRGTRVFALDLKDGIDKAPEVPGVTYVPADVTDPGQVGAAVAVAAGSGAALRTVVNCAGIGPSARIFGKKGVHDLALYAKVVQINLIGTFNVLALAAEAIAPAPANRTSCGQRAVATARSARPPTRPPRAAWSA